MATIGEMTALADTSVIVTRSDYEEAPCCPSLNFAQRVIGFAGFSFFGTFLLFMSVIQWPELIVSPEKWVASYTVGNCCLLSSTFVSFILKIVRIECSSNQVYKLTRKFHIYITI